MGSRSTVREGVQQRQGASTEGLPPSPARFITKSSSTTPTSISISGQSNQNDLLQSSAAAATVDGSHRLQQNELLQSCAAAPTVDASHLLQQNDLLQSCAVASSVQPAGRLQQNEVLQSHTTSGMHPISRLQQNELLQSCAAASVLGPTSGKLLNTDERDRASSFPLHEHVNKEATSAVPTSNTSVRQIVLSPEILAGVRLESERLEKTSVICKVFGGRPNRQGIRDCIQGFAQGHVNVVRDIVFLGKGFYLVEFEDNLSVEYLLRQNPMEINGLMFYFSHWMPFFNPEEAMSAGGWFFPVTVMLPGLPKQYWKYFQVIVGQLGRLLSDGIGGKRSADSDLPVLSARLLIRSIDDIVQEIQIPKEDGTFFLQRVEYIGLPNQCYYCKKVGHMIAVCPKRLTKMEGKGKEKMTEEYNSYHASKPEENRPSTSIQVEPQQQDKDMVEIKQSVHNPVIIRDKGKQVVLQQEQPQDMEWQIVKSKPGNGGKEKQIGTTPAQLSKALVIHNSYKCLDNQQDDNDQMEIQSCSSASLQVPVEIPGGEIQIFAASGTTTSRVSKVRKRTTRPSSEKPHQNFVEAEVHSVDINTLPLIPTKVKEAHLRKKNIPYPFLNVLGVEAWKEEKPVRVHVIVASKSNDNNNEPLGGFSFILNNIHNKVWDKLSAVLELKVQIMFFAKILLDHSLQQVLEEEWSKLEVFVKKEADPDGVYHMFLSLSVCDEFHAGYKCVLDDMVVGSQASLKSYYCWWIVTTSWKDKIHYKSVNSKVYKCVGFFDYSNSLLVQQ